MPASLRGNSQAPLATDRDVSRHAEVLALITQIGDDPESLVAAESALRRIVEHKKSLDRNLTNADVSALARMGVPAETLRETPSFSQSTSSERDEALAWQRSYTANEVAEILGVSPTRVRQRAAQHTLYAKRHGSGWIFPALQFPNRQEVPGWGIVAQAIPTTAPVLLVDAALSSPNLQLEYDGEERSPLEWLAAGGDPELAARAVSDDLTRMA